MFIYTHIHIHLYLYCIYIYILYIHTYIYIYIYIEREREIDRIVVLSVSAVFRFAGSPCCHRARSTLLPAFRFAV